MNYLGLDYGQKHIGVAVATGSLAEPLTTIPTDNALQLIKELVAKHSIEAIIIGSYDEQFKKVLEQLKIPVHEVDETLSSHDARQFLLHVTQKKRRLAEHSVSAAIILQSWLDKESIQSYNST